MGFKLPCDYQRSSEDDDTAAAAAKLPQGTIYLNFPVWSPDGLATALAAQTKAVQRAKESLVKRDYELLQMKAATNPLKKVWHYRNAYAAAETHAFQPLQHYQEIVPSSEDEQIRLPGDLVLTTKGFVSTKQLPNGPQSLLGTAKLTKLG